MGFWEMGLGFCRRRGTGYPFVFQNGPACNSVGFCFLLLLLAPLALGVVIGYGSSALFTVRIFFIFILFFYLLKINVVIFFLQICHPAAG